jgi:DNA-binding response OmpR family regulator
MALRLLRSKRGDRAGDRPTVGEAPVEKRVLVLEDEPDIAAVMELTLARAGRQIRLAGTLGEARARLAAWGPPDLLLVDLVLPDGDGLVLCREVKALWPQVAVLVVTARAAAREQVRAAGADAYLAKPFDPDDLDRVAARLLGGAR